ncbi:O-methyltransferase lepI [Pseudocercospora fuligena]|uniref:O-methyltransferase lepI n=1 Tax=Pseudocercospora fuligena TaxID=685502 RepID=A0A8H6VDB1_9PEZI|nr:O-methyltransferase lepI [Pseudocercospora fuligena]
MFATNLINGLPAFLKGKAYPHVNDSKDTVSHQLYDTDIDCFEYIASRPDLLEASQRLYREQSAERKSWIHEASVPKDDFVLGPDDLEAGRVLFVDIGGGMGHQCLELRKAHPTLKGRFVLEDVPAVLEMAKNSQPLRRNDIEIAEQDIFQPQSVIGAKVYYMRSVLHSYPDGRCLVILKHLRLAMRSDSILIVDDMVLAEHQPDYKSIDYDLLMMCAQAGMERWLLQFDCLLRQAGFKIRDVWKYDADDKIIVAMPGDEVRGDKV